MLLTLKNVMFSGSSAHPFLYGSNEVEKSKVEIEFAFLTVLNLFISLSTIFLFHITTKFLLSVKKLYSSL